MILTSACRHDQLPISKLMGGSLMAEGYWLMLNEVGLSQIGDLADLVVDLELPGLGVKKLTRSILGGNFTDFNYYTWISWLCIFIFLSPNAVIESFSCCAY